MVMPKEYPAKEQFRVQKLREQERMLGIGKWDGFLIKWCKQAEKIEKRKLKLLKPNLGYHLH